MRMNFCLQEKKSASRLMNFVNRNSVVLDVGCGIGRVERYLAPIVKKYLAWIYPEEIAKKSLKNHENVHSLKIMGEIYQFLKIINLILYFQYWYFNIWKKKMRTYI